MTTDIDRSLDVSGAHEPSYYEIALTNRQVVVAFVILLTCVVAAFFSGVWIGRESSVRAQERLALLARAHGGHAADRVDAMGNPIADKDKPEGQALQEFKFFADSRRHPGADSQGPPQAAAGKGAGAAARDAAMQDAAAPDAGSRDQGEGAAASGSPAPSAASRRATNTALLAPSATAGARPAPSARSTAAPADDNPAGEGEPLPGPAAQGGKRAGASESGAKATAKSAAVSSGVSGSSGVGGSSGSGGAAHPSGAGGRGTSGSSSGTSESGTASASGTGTAGATAAGDLVIQVFSTADREQADRVRESLSGAGFAAFLSPIAKGAQTMYRVRIGPFASRADAEAVAEKVRKEHKLDTWITPK